MDAAEEPLSFHWGHGAGLCGIGGGDTADGARVYTGGEDGQIEVYDAATGAKAGPTALTLDVEITAVVLSPDGKEVAIGTQDNFVKLYSLPSFEFKDNVTRFTAPVRDVVYSPDGTMMAMCSEEPGVRIVRLSRLEKSIVLKAHGDGGVRSLAWDPKGEFLASCGFDGTVTVWSVSQELDDLLWDPLCNVSTLPREAPGKSWGNAGKMSWRPDGSSLAIPGERSVTLLARNKWEPSYVEPASAAANHSAAAGGVCAVAWSPDGKWLASAGMDKRVIIWDPATFEARRTFSAANDATTTAVCGMRWLGSLAPGAELDTLALQAANGSYSFLLKVSPAPPPPPLPMPVATAATAATPAASKSGGGSSSAKRRLQKSGGASASAATDDEDEALFEAVAPPSGRYAPPAASAAAAARAAAAAKKGGSGGSSNDSRRLLDEEAAVASDGNVSDAETVHHEVAGDGGGNGGAGNSGDRTLGPEDDVMDADLDVADDSDARFAYAPPPKTMAMQDAFMPSSTPLGSRRRFLCWNNAGCITAVDEGTHNTIEIEPSDLQAARVARFQDSWGFAVGSLSGDGAFFATPGEADDEEGADADGSGGGNASGRRSVLLYKSLRRNSNGTAAQWTKFLPASELTLLVAAGAGWAAAATSRRLVRVFTSTGFQAEIFALPGPVVCLAGDGPLLLVVYHAGPPGKDCQALEMIVLNVPGRREVATSRLCLTADAELLWAGFGDGGMPVAMDTAGMLWGLATSLGLRWTPMLDTKEGRKNKTDLCWPVAVQTWRLACVVLKGGEEHPSTQPRPVLIALELTGPMAPGSRADSKEALRFERMWVPGAARIAQLELNAAEAPGDDDLEQEIVVQQAELDKALLKAFRAACAAGLAERALDLALRLALQKSFLIAINISNQVGLTQLASRVERVMLSRETAEEEDSGGYNGYSGGNGGYDADESGYSDGLRQASSGGGGGGPLARAARAIEQRRPARAAELVASGDGGSGGNDGGGDSGVDRYGNQEQGGSAEGQESEETPEGMSGISSPAAPRHDGEALATPEAAAWDGGNDGGGEADVSIDATGGEEEVQEVDAPTAAAKVPVNPFARGNMPPPARGAAQSLLQSFEEMKSSPSPLGKRASGAPGQKIGRSSSFAAEARTKAKRSKNVL